MAKRDLTKEQLSESFSIACLRLHDEITKFYEDLHDVDGGPCINPGIVANMITVAKVIINHDIDFIKEASYQHFEANYDQSEQAEHLLGNGEGT